MDAALQKQILKMAVQTVLFQYKPMLNQVGGNVQLLEHIAAEIAALYKEMETITVETWKQFEEGKLQYDTESAQA